MGEPVMKKYKVSKNPCSIFLDKLICDDSPSIFDKYYTWIIHRKGHAFDVRRSQPNLNTREAYGTNI